MNRGEAGQAGRASKRSSVPQLRPIPPSPARARGWRRRGGGSRAPKAAALPRAHRGRSTRCGTRRPAASPRQPPQSPAGAAHEQERAPGVPPAAGAAPKPGACPDHSEPRAPKHPSACAASPSPSPEPPAPSPSGGAQPPRASRAGAAPVGAAPGHGRAPPGYREEGAPRRPRPRPGVPALTAGPAAPPPPRYGEPRGPWRAGGRTRCRETGGGAGQGRGLGPLPGAAPGPSGPSGPAGG